MPICPRCKLNERKVTPGRVRSYCIQCERDLGRLASAKFRKSNPEYYAEWRDKNRDYVNRLQREAYDPIKVAARNAANKAYPEPQCCEKCGYFPAERHHDDYSKPLEIMWLCRMCHSEHHRLED